MLLIWSNANSQSLSANLAWLTGVQDRGASPFITKTDHLGNTHALGIYNGCQTCFMKMDGSFIIEMGNDNDYLFLMKIDEDGNKDQPLLIPSNGRIRIADFDINLNNELIVYLNADSSFFFNSTEIEEGYSILNLAADYQPNWIKNSTSLSNSLQLILTCALWLISFIQINSIIHINPFRFNLFWAALHAAYSAALPAVQCKHLKQTQWRRQPKSSGQQIDQTPTRPTQ